MSFEVVHTSCGTASKKKFVVYDLLNGTRLTYPMFDDFDSAERLRLILSRGEAKIGDYRWEVVPADDRLSGVICRDSHLARKPSVGEVWRMRNGLSIIEPLRKNNNAVFTLCAKCEDGKFRTWKEDGRVEVNGQSGFDLFDVIEKPSEQVGGADPNANYPVVDCHHQCDPDLTVAIHRLAATHKSGVSVVWDRGVLSITVNNWGASIEDMSVANIRCLAACFQGLADRIDAKEKTGKD